MEAIVACQNGHAPGRVRQPTARLASISPNDCSEQNVHSPCKRQSRGAFTLPWRGNSARRLFVLSTSVRKRRQQAAMGMELQEGDAAPDFLMPTDQGGQVSLKEFTGRPVVLYFYPKANTP
ncbi:hypothetical protein F1559_002546 [Cyanidiococcus yangmingshanensis]|uniref:Alkyl hydroperoxide reductase subunit C/ Thiol specific antioxidant domain-containing protein n=1 Tax=Cyanidiococcus yangmingshanensis TaxID=2690220 RepID=A0A7J7IJL5_9RHOD|nr:hypothetical protein F1559_002546 [Cyanidiococcus yangmingshanensis]